MNYRVVPAVLTSILAGAPFPYFKVMLQGSGILFPFEDGNDMIGFVTTRVVQADSESDAIVKAKALVHADWSQGEYAAGNRGSLPRLSIDKVWRATFYDALRFNNTGHVFYSSEDEEEEEGGDSVA